MPAKGQFGGILVSSQYPGAGGFWLANHWVSVVESENMGKSGLPRDTGGAVSRRQAGWYLSGQMTGSARSAVRQLSCYSLNREGGPARPFWHS